jgi:uncharacterized protein GlcG (DUF336 family)
MRECDICWRTVKGGTPGVCEKAAAAEGVQIGIMVLDDDGNHVYMDRMDGQGYLNIVIADMKARTALRNRGRSKELMNRVISRKLTSELPTNRAQFAALQ